MVVPARREDRRDGGLADVAAPAPAVALDQLVERGDALHADEVVELLAGVREVFAEVGVDFDAALFELRVQHCVTRGAQPPQPVPALVQPRTAPSVVAPSPTAADDRTLSRRRGRSRSGRCPAARPPPPAGMPPPSRWGRIRASGMLRQGKLVQHRLQQHAVVGRIARPTPRRAASCRSC